MTSSPDNIQQLSLPIFLEFFKQRQVPLEHIKDYKNEPIEKILKFWRNQGLVPFMEKGKWARISFAELIWLRILDSLRNFSYPIQRMKLICDYFYSDAFKDNLPKKNMELAISQLTKKETAGTISDEEKILLKGHTAILNNYPMILDQLKSDVNYLTNLIHLSINSGQEAGILILADGSVGELLNRDYYFTHEPHNNNNNIIPRTPHIYLSITYYLQEFIDQEDLSYIMLPQLLNKDEAYVLNQLRNKAVQELTIVLTGGEIKKIRITKTGIITESQTRDIKRILGLKNYEQITLSTRDEKTISFKKIQTKK